MLQPVCFAGFTMPLRVGLHLISSSLRLAPRGGRRLVRGACRCRSRLPAARMYLRPAFGPNACPGTALGPNACAWGPLSGRVQAETPHSGQMHASVLICPECMLGGCTCPECGCVGPVLGPNACLGTALAPNACRRPHARRSRVPPPPRVHQNGTRGRPGSCHTRGSTHVSLRPAPRRREGRATSWQQHPSPAARAPSSRS